MPEERTDLAAPILQVLEEFGEKISNLRGFVTRKGVAPQDAEDVLQDAFVLFIRRRRKTAVAKELVRNNFFFCVREAVKTYHQRKSAESPSLEVPGATHASQAPGPERIALGREYFRAVFSTLENLDLKIRAALVLRAGDWPIARIAKTLQMPESTLYRELKKAVEELRRSPHAPELPIRGRSPGPEVVDALADDDWSSCYSAHDDPC